MFFFFYSFFIFVFIYSSFVLYILIFIVFLRFPRMSYYHLTFAPSSIFTLITIFTNIVSIPQYHSLILKPRFLGNCVPLPISYPHCTFCGTKEGQHSLICLDIRNQHIIKLSSCTITFQLIQAFERKS